MIGVLLAAAGEECDGEVPEARLLRAAGGTHKRLADVFKGSQAWGELIVPGERERHYRIAPPPEADAAILFSEVLRISTTRPKTKSSLMAFPSRLVISFHAAFRTRT